MPDGTLSIGARLDKSQLQGDFASVDELVKSTQDALTANAESSQKRIREAVQSTTEVMRNFGKQVSQASIEAANGLNGVAAAQKKVTDVALLMRRGMLDAAQGAVAMAAAQKELATVQAESSLKAVAAAAEEAAAAHEAALSSNWIVAGFQRAGVAVRESLTGIQAKLVEVAETSKVSAEGITSGFAGLSSLLGAGIAAGFAAHFIDENAKVNVGLSHLAEKTGIAVGSLSGLREIVKETGADFDAVSTGLIRMDKNIADSAEPSKQLDLALGGIGLRFEDLRGLNPEEKLQKIAAAMAGTANASNRTAAAIALFGRGGAELIPILVQQGAALEANIKAKQKDTGVTEQAVSASQRWIQNMAMLTEGFQRFGNFVIENMHYVGAVLDGIGATFQTVFEGIGAAIVALAKEFFALGKTIYDALHFNVTSLGDDIQKVIHSGIDEIKAGGHDIADAWRSVGDLWKAQPVGGVMRVAGGGTAPPGAPPAGDGSSQSTGRSGGKSAPGASGSVTVNGAVPPAPETQSPDMSGANAALIAGLREEVRQNQDAARQMTAADRDAAQEKIRIAEEDYRTAERYTAEEVRLGRMSPKQRVEALRVAAAQEEQIRLQQAQFLEALDMNDRRRSQQDLGLELQARRSYAEQVMQINQQAAMDWNKVWQNSFADLTNGFSASMSRWIMVSDGYNTQFGVMMGRMMVGVAEQFTQHLIQMEIQKKASEAQQVAIHAAGEARRVAITVAAHAEKLAVHIASEAAHTALVVGSAATRLAIEIASVMKTIVMYAASAAVKSWDAMAAIPIVGPALGAAAAGAVFAGALHFAGAFEQGGIVAGGRGMAVPILAHAGERVLTAQQTQHFERMVNQSNATSNSITNHFHDNSNYSAIDGASVAGMVRKHGSEWRREAMRQMRLMNAI